MYFKRIELIEYLPDPPDEAQEQLAFLERWTTKSELEWMISCNQELLEEEQDRGARARSVTQVVAGLSISLLTAFLAVGFATRRPDWWAPCLTLAVAVGLCLLGLGVTIRVRPSSFTNTSGYPETFRGEAELVAELRRLRVACDRQRLRAGTGWMNVCWALFQIVVATPYFAYPVYFWHR